MSNKIIAIDIETNLSHDKIWCACTEDADGVRIVHTSPETLAPLLYVNDVYLMHGGIDFDAPVLRRVWGLVIEPHKIRDTLVMSRLEMPDRKFGHSLESWGQRAGILKINYQEAYKAKHPLAEEGDCFNDPDLPMLYEYCQRDSEITWRVYNHLTKKLLQQGFSGQSIDLEHKVAETIARQRIAGAYFDLPAAQALLAELTVKYVDLYSKIEKTFPPTVVEMKTKTKLVPFNPGSRQQIAERLIARGWKPKKFTPSGQPAIDDEVLAELKYPEAELLSEMFMLNSRMSVLKQMIAAVNDRTGRIHGKISTNGAVTGRMTHFSPNLANIPANNVPYGREIRAMFCAPPGKVMVGIDASSLELRMLAHYMKDPKYTEAVVSGDVHWLNAQSLGLVPPGTVYDSHVPSLKQARDRAKTFIYAFIYGAGSEKLGTIVGGGAKHGSAMSEKFLKATPALRRVLTLVKQIASNKGMVPGLDDRKIHIRQVHSALNALLQGAGAILMKKALVIFEEKLIDAGIWHQFALNVHDEWQLYTDPEHAQQVGLAGVEAIAKAGEALGLRCPMTGEFKIGGSWADTH